MARHHVLGRGAGAAILAGVAAVATHGENGAPQVRFELTQVREQRVIEVVKPPPDAFVMPDDRPGLLLIFNLHLPKHLSLLAIEEPAALEAADSTGRDLTKVPKPKFGEHQYVESVMTFDDDGPEQFELHLGLPERGASSFDVDAKMAVSVYESTKDVSFTLTKTWTKLDSSWFDGRDVHVRLGGGFMGAGPQFKPVEAREMIESLSATVGDDVFESSGSAWDNATITYMVDGELVDGATIQLTLRQGFQVLPFRVSLENQALP